MMKKLNILRTALEQIALANKYSDPVALARGATQALREASECQEYKIVARTWIGKNGGLCYISLFNKDTNDVLHHFIMNAITLDSWAYAIASWMNESRLFPACPHGTPPTIYIRDICKVEYTHHEVARKKDLK